MPSSPGLSGIILETPTLAKPTNVKGPINSLASWTVRREINKGGTWSVRFPASEALASQIVTGWRVTLTQENNAFETNLLYRGIVKSHRFVIDPSGMAMAELSGIDRLGALAETIIHTGKTFTNANLATMVAGITSLSINTPASKTQLSNVVINDQTVLGALLKIAQLYRCNIRESWSSLTDAVMTDQDNLPAPDMDNNTNFNELVFRNMAVAGPELANLAYYSNIGLIAGAPTVSYEGSGLVNRITPVGADYDGGPLTLSGFTSYDPLFTLQTGTNPDGSNYYYIEDTASQTKYGLIETQLVRTDVKNPSNDATTKKLAQGVLYAVAASELLQRRYEIVSVNIQIANGYDIWALPGDYVRVIYNGVATLADGASTWLNLSDPMLVIGRTDTGDASGSRIVTFDLAMPAVPYAIPNLPGAISIPTPRPQDTKKVKDPLPNDLKPDTSMDQGGNAADRAVMPSLDALSKALKDITHGTGAYQPCCADQTTDFKAGGSPPLAGAGIPSSSGGIAGASFGASQDTNIAPGPTHISPSCFASNDPDYLSTAARRIAFVFTIGATGTPTETSGAMRTFTQFFIDGTFQAWALNCAIGDAGVGLVTVPISGASSGQWAGGFHVNVGTSTAVLKFVVNQTLANTFALINEAGVRKVLSYSSGASNMPTDPVDAVNYTP